MDQGCEKQLTSGAGQDDDHDHDLLDVNELTCVDLDKEAADFELLLNQHQQQAVLTILREAHDSGSVVQKVDLFGHQIRFLPHEFRKLHQLLHLNLSHNQLRDLPDLIIAGLLKLERLDVSSNILESLPDSIGLLLNLKVLNCSGNKLNTLPDTISGCSSLVELDASFNDLRSLPINMGYGLSKLERLSIQLNKICYLPASICHLKSLTYLDAHFNQLHALPTHIGTLTNLQVLIVSGNFNNFTILPESITDLTNLRELDLSDNQITALPDSFGRLQKLLRLNMDQNPVMIPPMGIVDDGAQAVKDFMNMRWADLVAQKQNSMLQANVKHPDQIGWLAWGSSLWQTASEYMGGRSETRDDPWLYQQL